MIRRIILTFPAALLALLIVTALVWGGPATPSDDIELAGFDTILNIVYCTGTPEFDLALEFYCEHSRNPKDISDLIVGAGVRPDGYFSVLIREKDWDTIHYIVEGIQQMMGEDFPIIAVWVGNISPLGDTISVASS